MTLKFWKYLITNCNGSAICFVAESDRECAEKEFECDPRLLSYIASPQFECRYSAAVRNEFCRSFS